MTLSGFQPDVIQSDWVKNECIFIIVDGQHRLKAITNLKALGKLIDLETVSVTVMFPLEPYEVWRCFDDSRLFLHLPNIERDVVNSRQCALPSMLVQIFAFSERANYYYHETAVQLHYYDKICLIDHLTNLRYNNEK